MLRLDVVRMTALIVATLVALWNAPTVSAGLASHRHTNSRWLAPRISLGASGSVTSGSDAAYRFCGVQEVRVLGTVASSPPSCKVGERWWVSRSALSVPA